MRTIAIRPARSLIAFGLALCLPCAGAEAPEQEAVKRAAEEVCFFAAKLPVRQVLCWLNKQRPDEYGKIDPFSPRHFFSKVKPNMEAKPLPKPDENVRTRDVKLGEVTIAAPVPADYEARSVDPYRMVVFVKEGASITLRRSLLRDVDLDLPEELTAHAERAKGVIDLQAVGEEFERLKAMSEFDLLVAIQTCDVQALGSRVPFPRRVANLHLFAQKANFGPGPDRAPQYYEGKSIRCIVSQPCVGTTTYEAEGQVKERKEWKGVFADFAFRGLDAVYELELEVPKERADDLTLETALSFLANCRLKKAPKPQEAKPE